MTRPGVTGSLGSPDQENRIGIGREESGDGCPDEGGIVVDNRLRPVQAFAKSG